ncbi:MAG: hypothetical protein AAGA20_15230 [Planctomycetota bacterium]
MLAIALAIPVLLSQEATREPMALLEALTAEPRIVGTAGYDRALAIVQEELSAADVDVTIALTTTLRAVPHRSDVELFEDAIVDTPFAGLRERWDPDAVPTQPHPAAYPWNCERANFRGPIVDCGTGATSDFEDLAAYGIDPSGAVALVRVPSSSRERKDDIRSIAVRAGRAGCVALLVAPLEPGLARDDFVLEDTAPPFAMRRKLAAPRLALPTAPIRSVEAVAITERLRAKRVRGADGRGTTVRAGPGPVEARVAIECPVEEIGGPLMLFCPPKSDEATEQRAGRALAINLEERPDQLLGGALPLAAAILAATRGPDVEGSSRRFVLFAPWSEIEGTIDWTNVEGGDPSQVVLPDEVLGVDGAPPLINESVARLSKRLDGGLPLRLGAMSDWIERAMRPPEPAGR